MPLDPGEEAFHQPASLVAAQATAVLRLRFHPILSVRRDHLNALVPQLLIELVAVVGAIANEILRLRFDHVELETQLHQGDLMVVRRMGTDRQRQSVTSNNFHDFYALAALGRSNLITTTIGRRERWRAAQVSPEAVIKINGTEIKKTETFASVKKDEAFWYENSNGLLEIAVNHGSARELFNLEIGTELYLETI